MVCLANHLEFYLQDWQFDDAESRPTVAYRWKNITNLAGSVAGRYMMYTNAFDCITQTQVRQPLFACRLFLQITCCEKLQVIWQPYDTDEVEAMGLNSICKRDSELWRAEVPLIYYYVVEWHLPNRVLRQFGKLQPVDVQHTPTNESLHK